MKPEEAKRTMGMLLDEEDRIQTSVSTLDVSPEMMQAGIQLGYNLSEKEVIGCLASKPETDAVKKLILLNAASAYGRKVPNPGNTLDSLLEALPPSFLEIIFPSAMETVFFGKSQNEERQKYSESDSYSKIIGVRPELLQLIDDIYPMIEPIKECLTHVGTKDELIYLVSSAIIAQKTKQDLPTSGHSAQELLTLATSNAIAKQSREIIEGEGAKRYAFERSQAAEIYIRERTKITCTPFMSWGRPRQNILAWFVEKSLGQTYKRVLTGTEMLPQEFMYILKALEENGKGEEFERLIENSGLEDVSHLDEMIRRTTTQTYRGVTWQDGVDTFDQFIQQLPKRILATPEYDPKKSVTLQDEVIVTKPAGIINYKHKTDSLTPEKIPPGSVGEVIEINGNNVTVQINKADYIFDKSEVAVANPNNDNIDGKTVDDIAREIRLTMRAVNYEFLPDSFRDYARWSVVQSSYSNGNVQEAKHRVGSCFGLLNYFSEDSDVWRFLNKRDQPLEGRELPTDTRERVKTILKSHPGYLKFSEVNGDSLEHQLAYLLTGDPVIHPADFFNMDNPVERFVIAQTILDHDDDAEREGKLLSYHKENLYDVMRQLAVIMYQSTTINMLKNSERTLGIDKARLAEITGQREVAALLRLEGSDLLNELDEMSGLGRLSELSDRLLQLEGPKTTKEISFPKRTAYDLSYLKSDPFFADQTETIDYEGVTDLFMKLNEGGEAMIGKAYTPDDLREITVGTLFYRAIEQKPVAEAIPDLYAVKSTLRFVDFITKTATQKWAS